MNTKFLVNYPRRRQLLEFQIKPRVSVILFVGEMAQSLNRVTKQRNTRVASFTTILIVIKRTMETIDRGIYDSPFEVKM